MARCASCADKLGKESTAKRNEQGESLDQENRRLRKENEQLRIERTILKKAAAFLCHASVQ